MRNCLFIDDLKILKEKLYRRIIEVVVIRSIFIFMIKKEGRVLIFLKYG